MWLSRLLVLALQGQVLSPRLLSLGSLSKLSSVDLIYLAIILHSTEGLIRQ
ncbi:hypothetical protein AVDCRST_MAG92-3875 [uncultured Coleofasciculus sp.]|uniref:Uncharacterized protein n=1 Tax=uncultured Coleofasciculus sp. TaxID=1267456 RepID=A0A6J4JS87_9CYAN|nr:hypothetical protein AVDCRST_MAG92-3875 [uncultured Coleofasciculus sp.]